MEIKIDNFLPILVPIAGEIMNEKKWQIINWNQSFLQFINFTFQNLLKSTLPKIIDTGSECSSKIIANAHYLSAG